MGWDPRARLDEMAPQPTLGPGVSRPSSAAHARLHQMRVKCPGSAVMTVSLLAENRHCALRYAQNRWPDCSVEMIHD
jgi:hypothetical protein